MHPGEQLFTALKAALARACEDFARSAAQARDMRYVMERLPPGEVAQAFEERDGTSYVAALEQTRAALDELRAAYGPLHATIAVRRAGAEPRAGARRDA